MVMAAAVSKSMPSGSRIRESAGMTRSELYAPSGLPVYVTRSPSATWVTPWPTASTTPAASTPIPAGSGAGYRPVRK